MKSHIKYCIVLLTALLISFNLISYVPHTYVKSAEEKGYTSLDFENKDELPENFRTSSDISKIQNNKLELSGMDTLNIVGSAEFTELSLPKAKEAINTELPIYIVDLRQESHGYINGDAISLFAPGNKINAGFPLNAVIKRENLFLKSIPLNRTIFLDIDKYKIIPKTVYNEDTLVKNNELNYFRIPVTDNERPTDEMVDRFLEFVKKLPRDKFLYFHCKAGDGRTTTFMILYDIMNNYKNVNFDDIVERQSTLAGLNLLNFARNDLRFLFIENFFKYAKDTNFDTTWQEWVKSNNIEPFTLIDEKK